MRTGPLAAVIGFCVLAGCSSSGSGDMGQYIKVIKQSFGGALGTGGVTLQQAGAIPYASMGWRLDGGRENIIVLATDNEQGQLWTSAAHIVFLTQNGRLKRTLGLPHDLTALVAHDSAGLTPPSQALSGPYSQQRLADFPDMGSYQTAILCRGTRRGRQGIVILGKTIAVTRVDESCTAITLGWSFVDSYWIDDTTKFTWRARQHIHPHGDVVETEIFRPPG